MRARNKKNGVSVHAIAGTYVVLLGLDTSKRATKGLLGFAIRRRDHHHGTTRWLAGTRRFAEAAGEPPPGALIDSCEAPIQEFLWGDYTVRPGRKYTYTVYPVYGSPARLRRGESVRVAVTTEDGDDGVHAVYFNRGVAGSQAYSRKFAKYRRWYKFERYGRERWTEFIRPDAVPRREAWRWLSRGLEEALVEFIAQARGPRYALRASVYEFDYPPVIEAFAEALESGADVKIIHDARKRGRSQDGPWRETEAALRSVGLRKASSRAPFDEMMIPRTHAAISHNKFIILLEDGAPIEVWTGSANVTLGGIFGQSNVGHIVRDPDVAARYLEYWHKLAEDPKRRSSKRGPADAGVADWNVARLPDLTEPSPPNSITTIFSPRPDSTMLRWYADRIAAAEQSVHFTAAFGVADEIAEVLARDGRGDGDALPLRYVLLESTPSRKRSRARKERARAKGHRPAPDYYDFNRVSQNCVAAGAILDRREKPLSGAQVLAESLSGLDTHVNFLHTKYLLIDPLGDDPVVISGSANFSTSSLEANDENMLIIRGNTRVADIFLTEFTRLFKHFHIRDEIEEMSDAEAAASYFLCPDDSWAEVHFRPGTQENAERLLFR